jgi:hypothetical protein
MSIAADELRDLVDVRLVKQDASTNAAQIGATRDPRPR